MWIFETGGLCLLLRTNPARGGFWQPVTGGVEKDETGDDGWLAAAEREAREETGLPFAAPAREVGHEFEFQSRWGGLARERVFLLKTPGPAPAPRLDPAEHDAYQWVSPEDAMALMPFEGCKNGLRAALQSKS